MQCDHYSTKKIQHAEACKVSGQGDGKLAIAKCGGGAPGVNTKMRVLLSTERCYLVAKKTIYVVQFKCIVIFDLARRVRRGIRILALQKMQR